MKIKQFISVIVALTLVLGAAQQTFATAKTNRLSMALTFVTQGDTTTKTNTSSGAITYTSKFEKSRRTDKDLLKLLQTATGTAFPLGAFIEIDNDLFSDIVVTVRSKTGDVLADVSSFIHITGISDDIYSWIYTDATAARTSTDNYILEVTFDDGAGNSFDVSGMATEAFKATPVKNGQQTLTDSIVIPVTGAGSIDGASAVVKGIILLKGKSTSS
jgi:hypothetical protein